MKASKGGMQSSSARYSIYCEKCGKPAFRVVESANGDKMYFHFTKIGVKAHSVKAKEG